MSYLPTLDGWRAIAIAMVIAAHVRLPGQAFAGVFAYGALGVHLFFAISGFLITHQLLQQEAAEDRIDLRRFYIRRVFRILPAALLYLAVVFVVIRPDAWQIAAAALFFRNYAVAPAASGWYTAHYWSLSVEEHFYLLWPPLLMFIGIRRARFAVPALACMFALWRGLDGQFAWIATFYPSLRDVVWRSDYRMDGLLWGCAAAFVWNSARARDWAVRHLRGWHAGAVVALMAALLVFKLPGHIALLAALMPLPVLATVASPRGVLSRILESGVLSWLGRISYSVYLWQMLFLPAYTIPVRWRWAQSLPLNLVLVLACASASYYLMERPLRRFGRKLAARAGSRITTKFRTATA